MCKYESKNSARPRLQCSRVNTIGPPYGSLRDFHHRPSNLDSSAIDLFPGKPRITYGQDGKFKIVVFSDLHYGKLAACYCSNRRHRDASFYKSLGEAEDHTWGLEQDINSTRVMREMIKAENPNFVVINGDLITGESTQKRTVTLERSPIEACPIRYIQGKFNRVSGYNASSTD